MTADAQMVPCVRCGDFVDPNAATYNNDGELVCRGCDAREVIDLGEERAAHAPLSTALGALALACVSILFNPCMLLTVGAILSCLSSAKMMMDPKLRARMGWRVGATIGLIVLAIAVAVGRIVVPVLIVLGESA